jgi:hypothetical protein
MGIDRKRNGNKTRNRNWNMKGGDRDEDDKYCRNDNMGN